MARPAHLNINLSALKHNLKRLRALAPQSKLLAVAKANAYGHGIADLLPAFEEADGLGVCCVEEALELYELGYRKPIVVLQGFYDPAELKDIARCGFVTIVRDFEQLRLIETTNLKKPLSAWLKTNTGMNRLGFKLKEFSDAYSLLVPKANLNDLVLMTHFACADEGNHPHFKAQLEAFDLLTASHSHARSLANSAALLTCPSSHADWNRPGLACYGISPIAAKTGEDFGLRPVMSLNSEIIAIQHCQAGDSIGYSATYHCRQNMRIGIVAMGYADGYPQQAPSGTPVLVAGQATHTVGRTSMDMLMVDLTSIPEAQIGSTVTLWGPGVPVEQVAAAAKTSGYELVCGINERVRRRVCT